MLMEQAATQSAHPLAGNFSTLTDARETSVGSEFFSALGTGMMFSFGEPLARAGGVEFSLLPFGAKLRTNKNKLVRGIGHVMGFGSMADLTGAYSPLQQLKSYHAGTGPIYRTKDAMIFKADGAPGIRGKVNELMQRANNLWVGDAGKIGKNSILSQLDNSRLHSWVPKGSLRKQISGWKNLARSTSNSEYKALAQFHVRALSGKFVGRFITGASWAATALWALDIAGGIAKIGYNKGLESLTTKKQAISVLSNPLGETLRMKALQQASMSFGATRAAMGNEAMSYHTY